MNKPILSVYLYRNKRKGLIVVWTKNKIAAILNRSNEAVERAVVGIYATQPTDKKNNLGYSDSDYATYSKLARIIILNPNNKPLGSRLSVKQLNNARRTMKKYIHQLLYISNGTNQ